MFDNILNIQLYVTSAPAGNSHDGLSLALALELLYKKSRRDMVTGLKTQCKPGRPDWQTVLANIQKSSPYKVRDVLVDKSLFKNLSQGFRFLLWGPSSCRYHTANL